MNVKSLISFLLLLAVSIPAAFSQTPVQDTVQIINIIHADRLGFSKKDTANPIQYGAGNVQAQQKTTLFNADSAVINQRTKIFEGFGNVHINEGDTTHTYSQYLRHHFDTKKAVLQRKVMLTNGKTILTTEQLDYDMNARVGIYTNGGKIVNGSTTLTSKEGIYYDDYKDVIFRKNVVLIDPKYKLYADSLLYNTKTEIATFIGPTRIVDSSNREIITSEGFYDTRNKIAQFGRGSQIRDKNTFLQADDIFANDQTGERIARGNAIYVDTAQGITIRAGQLKEDGKTEIMTATLKPVMIIKQDEDSIYVTADTILSGRLMPDTSESGNQKAERDTAKSREQKSGTDSVVVLNVSSVNKNDSASRYLLAYHNVKIFSDSLQALSDSLYYSGVDSIFRLFYDPVIWASGSQITGDTIFLFTKNKKADRLYVFDKALVVNKAGPDMYNQIQGNTLNGYFNEGVIDYMRARGNAESIYYVKDEDSAFIGVNRSTADIIDMRFKDKQLNKVVYISDVKGTTNPFRQVNFSEMRLRNFQWLENKRPKTKFEVLGGSSE